MSDATSILKNSVKVILEPHSNKWKIEFEKIKIQFNRTLGNNVEIHHIGSTSIPGIKAKPIIDVLIGINDDQGMDDFIKPITDLGYEYISKFNKEMSYRRFFKTENIEGKINQNIHLVRKSHPFFPNHLFFRDHMRRNPYDAMEYEKLKIKLAEKDWEDRNDYAEAKSNFITGVLKWNLPIY